MHRSWSPWAWNETAVSLSIPLDLYYTVQSVLHCTIVQTVCQPRLAPFQEFIFLGLIPKGRSAQLWVGWARDCGIEHPTVF
jgi:hypothetical protein